jgi:hypothetical protein
MKRGRGYNLYVSKCQVLKTFYLGKVSFRINLKCNVDNIYILILHVYCNN